MFEQIFEFLSETWDTITPVFVLDEYDAGIVLRGGKFHKYANAGINFKIPVLDNLLSETVVPTTMELRAQTLTTKDGKLVVISSIVKYQIADIKPFLLDIYDSPFLLDIYDSQDVISDTTLGAIKKVVARSLAKELNIESKVLRIVRKEVSKYGVDVISIVFADQGCIKTLRLIQDE